jgi:hypothetical protein
VTPRTPKTPAPDRPPAAGAGGPHDPVTGEGNPTVEEAAPVSSTVGPGVPGAAVPSEGRERPLGSSTKGLSGTEWQKAARAAVSALHATQRRQGYKRSRDPFRRAVPGGRKPPPGGDAA